SSAACTSRYSRKNACSLWPRVYRHLLRTSRKMSHQSVYHIDRHTPPGESSSQPFELEHCSVPQGVLPDTGRRGYRMRSAICLLVCELPLSLSFPEVQPRAPAIYNMVRTNEHQFHLFALALVQATISSRSKRRIFVPGGFR